MSNPQLRHSDENSRNVFYILINIQLQHFVIITGATHKVVQRNRMRWFLKIFLFCFLRHSCYMLVDTYEVLMNAQELQKCKECIMNFQTHYPMLQKCKELHHELSNALSNAKIKRVDFIIFCQKFY